MGHQWNQFLNCYLKNQNAEAKQSSIEQGWERTSRNLQAIDHQMGFPQSPQGKNTRWPMAIQAPRKRPPSQWRVMHIPSTLEIASPNKSARWCEWFQICLLQISCRQRWWRATTAISSSACSCGSHTSSSAAPTSAFAFCWWCRLRWWWVNFPSHN